ncbi:MAG: PSD1 domain-containing protein [Candidatus Solibacter usitatus]|nr:PSD1 domain-containing protein [Candidatus Solibacter usitatus]
MQIHHFFSFIFLLFSPITLTAATSFNRDIRPIMSDTCFQCHGPDKNTRMAGLRLDIREEALQPTKSGVTPIVPGNPAKSAIVERVLSANAAKLMPPAYSHKTLTPKQKETIRQWVAEGASYEGHWAYQSVKRPEVPAARKGSTVRNPIDAFIQQRLEREGLRPAAEADRRTLIRRVSLDLTGLPPTPSEIDAFLKDTSPNAYEKVVDRLLASAHYAEKQAIHWLDAVRYADTCGFHGDNPFPAWPYRDYVLRAFRDNKPFDMFTREHLAGDLMPESGVEGKIASAYNRLNRTSAEGGLQPKEYLAKYGADRVRTTSTLWLGSTMGCAECHDHKFDPFTIRDFYSFKAFFADIQETGLVPDRGVKAWGSQITLPSEEQKAKLERLNTELKEAKQQLEQMGRALEANRAAWEKAALKAYQDGEIAWHFQRPVSAKSDHGAVLRVYNDEPVESTSYAGSSLATERRAGNGTVVVGGPNPDKETYTVVLRPGAGTWAALGLEAIQEESQPGIRVARGSDRLVVTEVGAGVPFSLASASFSGVSPEYHAMSAIDGDPNTGWGIATYGENRNLFLALRFREPLTTTADSTVTVRIRHDSEFRRATIGRFRLALSTSTSTMPEPEEIRRRRLKKGETGEPKIGGLTDQLLTVLRKPEAKRTEDDKQVVVDQMLWSSKEAEPALIRAAKLEAAIGLLEAAIPKVVITQSGEPSVTRVLARSNWMDDSGEIVEPAIPSFLGKLNTTGRATRLDLANWLVSPQNPLTARAFVNRMWRLFFGTGLSKVLEDLGSQGEWPAHTELLDFLAAEFMKPEHDAEGTHAWDVKHLIRMIVTSHAYRQSSLGMASAKDPDNRLLARQNRYRVDAEAVRDMALSVSGLLEDRFGGPSARPYQPEGYLAALNFPKRDYSASTGVDQYRRGVYTVWQRTFLHPSMMTFDAPSREECTLNRVSSNTPLQALVLLNDPIFVESARVFAQNILHSGGKTLSDRIDFAFLRALGRRATPAERQTIGALHQRSLVSFTAKPASAAEFLKMGDSVKPANLKDTELAAMTTVARAILNLHETITRN